VNNCGVKGAGCGHQCVTPNATPTCAGGLCLVQQCNTGFKDCDMAPANGCEVNIQNDPNNCGGCNVKCSIANGTAACVNGMCAVGTCANGFADCDGQVNNGCETPVGTDTSNCGTCGHVCALANASQTCTGGICTIGSCNPGFANCDNQQSNGCEASTTNDPLNCGSCNHQCFVAQGTAGCAMGACTVASCNPGYADCNGVPNDGCEDHVATDPNNCGTCGNACATSCSGNVAATTCATGACTITACNAGHFNLDGACSNGCECASSGTSSTCGNPTSLGGLQVGQGTSYVGNLVPAAQEAYLSVTFNGNTNPLYHPHITLTQGAAEFLFDVEVNCSGTLIGCAVEGGASNGRSEWEEVYTGGDSTNVANFQAIPPVGTAGQVIIHVYRKPGLQVTCNNFALTIGN